MHTTKLFAMLIDDLLNDKVSCEDASGRVIALGKEHAQHYPNTKSKLIEDAFESIIHFCSDKDIRDKDTVYADRQRKHLQLLYQKLIALD